MSGTGRKAEKLIEYLALDGYATRLCSLQVTRDALSWTRFCGSLSLVLVVLLFLSGAFMMFYYSPTPGAAYDSVDFAQFSLPFGDVVRGVHYYAWNLLLIVLGLHLAGTFLTAAYKAPRQLVWVSGMLIMLVVPAFIITGDLLPWDQKGYWTTQVRNSIISSVPLLGDFILRLLQGGSRTGIVALTRFYVLHSLFLPCLLVVLIAIHFHFLAHRGLSEPLRESKLDRGCVPLVPDLVNRWLILFVLVAVVLGLGCRSLAGSPGQPGRSHGLIIRAQAGVVGALSQSAGQHFPGSRHVYRHRRYSRGSGRIAHGAAFPGSLSRAPSAAAEEIDVGCRHHPGFAGGALHHGLYRTLPDTPPVRN